MKKILAVIIIIAALITAITLIRQKKQASSPAAGPLPADSRPAVLDEPIAPPALAEGANIWEGTLKTSDNEAKGNLMLQTKERVIYIKTSRDFSDLLDKEVAVTYQGGFEEFILGDIKAK